PRPGAGGVHHPARVDLALRRHHPGAAARLDPEAAHLDAEALLGTAPLRVTQVAPEERVHVDVAVVREEGRAREALGEERRYAREAPAMPPPTITTSKRWRSDALTSPRRGPARRRGAGPRPPDPAAPGFGDEQGPPRRAPSSR